MNQKDKRKIRRKKWLKTAGGKEYKRRTQQDYRARKRNQPETKSALH